jgi:hypothetical protein
MLFSEGNFFLLLFNYDLKQVLRSLIGIAISQSKGKSVRRSVIKEVCLILLRLSCDRGPSGHCRMADPDSEQNGDRDGKTDRVHQRPFWFTKAFQLQSRTSQYPPIH